MTNMNDAIHGHAAMDAGEARGAKAEQARIERWHAEQRDQIRAETEKRIRERDSRNRR